MIRITLSVASVVLTVTGVFTAVTPDGRAEYLPSTPSPAPSPGPSPQPYTAADPDANPHAVINWSLEDRREHRVTRVHVQAPRDAWGLRGFLREVNSLDLGVRISMYGPCTRYPGAACIHVRVAQWTDEQMHREQGYGWWGLTRFPRADYRTIWLNTLTPADIRYAVAVHEFGHILGFGHHKDLGICGRTPNVVHLSSAELRELRRVY